MKSTIKIDKLQAIVLQPTADKTAMRVDLTTAGVTVITKTLTADQAAVMGFAIDSVLEVIKMHADAAKRMAA